MSVESSEIDRHRAVHDWVREALGTGSAAAHEHLDENELAALVEGGNLAEELRRAENHLFICVACRDAARSLVRDYVVVVAEEMRRVDRGPREGTRMVAKMGRRWSPLLFGILAFAVLAGLPWSWQRFFAPRTPSVARESLVLSRVGTPTTDAGEGRMAAETGFLLERGVGLDLGSGDVVTALCDDGSIVRVTSRATEVLEGPDPRLARLFTAARGRRKNAPLVPTSAPTGERPRGGPVVLEPTGPILGDRPRIVWSDSVMRDAWKVIVAEEGGDGAEIIDQMVKGAEELAYPRTAPALTAGKNYRVRIVPWPLDSGPATETVVRVLGASERNRINDEWRAIESKLRRGPSLVRAEFLIGEGLFSEAASEIGRLRLEDQSNAALLETAWDLATRLGLDAEARRLARLLTKRRGK